MITKTNSTMMAPAYTITCAAARNSAPSSRYSTASEPITPTSEMALEIGCVCTTTLMPQITAMAAKMRKRMTSMSGEQGHHKAGDQQVKDGHREHELPREGHQLIVAEARQRAPNPDEDEQQNTGLEREPEQRHEHGLQGRNQKQHRKQEEHHGHHRQRQTVAPAGRVQPVVQRDRAGKCEDQRRQETRSGRYRPQRQPSAEEQRGG